MGRKKTGTPDVATPMGRVEWLLDNHYDGSPAKMAKATGVSLTGIAKVVSGQQDPGRRLLETIVHNTRVSPAWLYAGEGPPLRGSAIPVAYGCLPGPPANHADRIRDEPVPEVADLYSLSRYWLKLQATEPAVKVSGTNLAKGDLLLMETARSLFPTPDNLDGRWCVVRLPGKKEFKLRLAQLSYISECEDNGPAHLEAETFESHPTVGLRIVIDEFPGGEVKLSKHKVRYEPATGSTAGKPGVRKAWESSILPRQVAIKDVIAVCVLVVRRFG